MPRGSSVLKTTSAPGRAAPAAVIHPPQAAGGIGHDRQVAAEPHVRLGYQAQFQDVVAGWKRGPSHGQVAVVVQGISVPSAVRVLAAGKPIRGTRRSRAR